MRAAGSGVLRLEITDEIDAALADTVARHLTAYSGHTVEMLVDTIGGDWTGARLIFLSLTNHRRRVTAYIRKAASGGALIAMGADFRQMDPAGHFFLHRPSGPYTKSTLDDIAAAKAKLMAGRCRVPAARLRRWMDESTTIDAERALAIGLVDEVPGLPKPRQRVVFL